MSQPKDQHAFDVDLPVGKAGEKEIDAHFSKMFIIETVPLELDKLGIDRIWTDRLNGRKFSVEYKTCRKIHETGNFFVETISVDNKEKSGWAYTCLAQLIVYYSPSTGEMWLSDVVDIKRCLRDWVVSYPTSHAQNVGYRTYGVLVPKYEYEDKTLINKYQRED